MSEYGRWRENEDRLFDAWWNRFGPKLSRFAKRHATNEYLHDNQGYPIAIGPRDDDEREMARVAAREAWAEARKEQAP